jgi:hypothetical protein
MGVGRGRLKVWPMSREPVAPADHRLGPRVGHTDRTPDTAAATIVTAAGATIVDRLTFNATLIQTGTESCRLARTRANKTNGTQ